MNKWTTGNAPNRQFKGEVQFEDGTVKTAIRRYHVRNGGAEWKWFCERGFVLGWHKPITGWRECETETKKSQHYNPIGKDKH